MVTAVAPLRRSICCGGRSATLTSILDSSLAIRGYRTPPEVHHIWVNHLPEHLTTFAGADRLLVLGDSGHVTWSSRTAAPAAPRAFASTSRIVRTAISNGESYLYRNDRSWSVFGHHQRHPPLSAERCTTAEWDLFLTTVGQQGCTKDQHG
jgi:hypothetical protein